MASFCPHCRRRLGAWDACSCGGNEVRPALGTATLERAPVEVVQRVDLKRRVSARRGWLSLAVVGVIGVIILGFGVLVATQPDTFRPTTTPVTRAGTTGGTSSNSGGTGLAASESADPTTALAAQRSADRSALSGEVGMWLPQVSSKRVGMRADGITYDEASIWAQFQNIHAAHPEARLAWSDDWTSFRSSGYWVTLIDQPFSTPSGANAWCASEGFPADQCYAKRLMTTGTFDGNTVTR